MTLNTDARDFKSGGPKKRKKEKKKRRNKLDG